MYWVFFTTMVLFWSLCSGQTLKCQTCGSIYVPICGKDGNTYNSICVLEQNECMLKKKIGVACNGECPCDSKDGEDAKTVTKYESRRLENQDEREEKITFQILDSDKDELKDAIDFENIQKAFIEQEDTKKYFKKGSEHCPTEEMSELPARLIDWFHVLKTNEKEKEFEDQGIEQEPFLKEMGFLDSKLKAMYSALACNAQETDELEKQVCLTPVQWMFHHLDSNKDSSLSPVELYEIEQIDNEHCIKPFLKDCDADHDGKVFLKEFCKCLCLTPPCTQVMRSVPTIIMRGEPRPMPGLFAPVCDEDGFFMPKQCNKKRNECWCVDRNGAEYEGTRRTGDVNCEINTTRNKLVEKNLIPLDLQKENSK